ncbi:MAG: immunoglobulin domain-containing protein, partial [Verrucomicrobiae bacterium]|nr:immunoglobulin domain-containing protein [Verrucomicrobiae bacterium]
MKRTCCLRVATLGCVASILLLAQGRAAPALGLPTVPAVDTQPVTVPVTLTAEGGENSLGWSVSFDPERLLYQQALLGEGATGAILFLNGSAAHVGQLGVLLSLPPGESFDAGEHTVLELRFLARGGAGNVPLVFTDTPVPRSTADVNGAGITTSYENGAVQIATLFAPTITQEPADQAVYAGANAVFRVAVASDAPERYQWRKNSVNLPGEQGAVLVVRGASAGDEGTYSVVVANGAGSVTSRGAALTVAPGLRGDLIGQWDFDGGDLVASVGRDLLYRGNTAEVTTYQT